MQQYLMRGIWQVFQRIYYNAEDSHIFENKDLEC